MTTKNHYNDLYKKETDPFGVGPSKLTTMLLDYISNGSVYEIGAGNGRNSLFLASKGFDVEINDTSDAGIGAVENKAKELNLDIKTNTEDVRSVKFSKEYDVVLSTFVFHHLKVKEGFQVVSKIKEATKKGGFNVISVFTKKGDFYKLPISKLFFYLEENELKDLYADWDVLVYKEQEGTAHETRADGTPMKNVLAHMIARKP
ncbi:hypothetical protein CL654_02405 [bacterium]|nr:hypothetical protein [bacterium]|tara:strand:- start:11605 stop:12213 length:609 start_codon:yes stop_codon:yes gene_type:complete